MILTPSLIVRECALISSARRFALPFLLRSSSNASRTPTCVGRDQLTFGSYGNVFDNLQSYIRQRSWLHTRSQIRRAGLRGDRCREGFRRTFWCRDCSRPLRRAACRRGGLNETKCLDGFGRGYRRRMRRRGGGAAERHGSQPRATRSQPRNDDHDQWMCAECRRRWRRDVWVIRRNQHRGLVAHSERRNDRRQLHPDERPDGIIGIIGNSGKSATSGTSSSASTAGTGASATTDRTGGAAGNDRQRDVHERQHVRSGRTRGRTEEPCGPSHRSDRHHGFNQPSGQLLIPMPRRHPVRPAPRPPPALAASAFE